MVERSTFGRLRRFALALALSNALACGEETHGDGCPDGACQPDCEEGTLGCACAAGEACTEDDGPLPVACVEGRCEHVMPELPAPRDARCYTPCTDDLVDVDGSLRQCDSEGLMLGCVGFAQCSSGSCILASPDAESDGPAGAPDEAGRRCAEDAECPDFQGCREGRCYSECEVDSECMAGFECRRHVCRVACTTGNQTDCPSNYVCTSRDGDLGVCLPGVSSVDAPEAPPRAEPRFLLSTRALALSNRTTSAKFSITNEADAPLRFVVRRKDHTQITDSGRVSESEIPLHWIRMAPTGEAPSSARELELVLDPGETREVLLTEVKNPEIDQWEGHIEVFQPGSGTQSVLLTYSTSPEGLWSGSIYYLVNFDEGGEGAMDAFAARPSVRRVAEDTHNALLAQWSDFVRNDLFTLQQWLAVMNATIEGSWDFPLVREACEEGLGANSSRRCYPFVAPGGPTHGLATYTDSDSLRIPSGVLEMPFALTLQQTRHNDRLRFSGAVQSHTALQYPGNPGVVLSFGQDPAGCERAGDACLVPVSDFSVTSFVGARRLQDDAPCAAGHDAAKYTFTQPWLVDTFLQGTHAGDAGPLRGECRDDSFPLLPASEDSRFVNASFAGGNPVPDGRRRERNLDLLDGRLINQDTLFMLVRERFDAHMDGAQDATVAGYGMVLLRRTAAELSAEDFKPSAQPAAEPEVVEAGLLESDGSLLCPALDLRVTPASTPAALTWLIEGQPDTTELTRIDGGQYKPYYLCHDTGHFNGGDPDWADPATPDAFPEPCPADSRVTYFLYRGRDDLRNDACQHTPCQNGFCEPSELGSCGERLQHLLAVRPVDLVIDPVFHCTVADFTPPEDEPDAEPPADLERTLCDGDRQHLLAEKIFYEPLTPAPGEPAPLAPLHSAMLEAFQYHTRFASNAGRQLGFVPAVCQLGGSATPYCYDPHKIEKVRTRFDCLARIYRAFPAEASARVEPLLTTSFGGASDQGVDGFERLYAGLMIMLGDDAFTRALGSRFDIAGAAVGSFDGDLFEPNGIALSGGAGFEMHSLYKARQAYELVLDRFYRQSGVLWEDVSRAEGEPRLVRAATITNYVGSVVLASTKKARVTSEIAKRYQGFGRPDLARHVIERDFARAYLESLLLNELLKEYARVVPARQLADLQDKMGRTQNLYRVALERMRETYNDLTDELTFFGDPVDFIPFPSPSRFDLVSPQVMLDRAHETMQVAKERDARAIESIIASGSDPARFQSDLRKVELEYENQLAELCGTFARADGTLFAATPKFAAEHPVLSLLPVSPCGLVGNGAIHEARGEVDIAATDLRIAVQGMRDIFERARIEQERVDTECSGRVKIAKLGYNAAGAVITLESEQHDAELAMSNWERELAVVDRASSIANAVAMTAQQASSAVGACSSLNPFSPRFECGAAIVATAAFGAGIAAESAGMAKQRQANADSARKQAEIHEAAERIANIQRTAQAQQQIAECDICPSFISGPDPDDVPTGGGGSLASCPVATQPGPLRVEAQARIDTLLVDMAQARLNGLRAQLNLNLAQGRLEARHHQAERVIAQADEAEQMLIDVEAQRNDPNVRLLRNADVIDADRAFHDALVDAYRATRVFEYFSAQSYGPKIELFFARLAARGEFSVENYLIDLQRALHTFENTFGRPSKRAHVVSLRDDVLRIPRLDQNGVALSDAERIRAFREALTAPERLNARGYLTFPFSIGTDAPSPLTSIHKVEHIEAEIQGSGVGDRLGRVYVTARGTATLRDLDGDLTFMRLPAITSVVETFFNGVKPTFVDAAVYQDLRLRERPLLNSLWELSLNLRDEQVNRDIQAQELTDVRLYIYYEDFTQLD